VGKNIILTEEGYNEIKKELEYLRGEKRNEIAEKIKAAREYGDLSENAEYEEAKNEQAFLEGKILELEHKLSNAVIAKKNNKKKGIIAVGSRVKLYDESYGEELTYDIVGSGEGNPDEGKISNESPLGSVLIGRKAGDKVAISVPNGTNEFEVLTVD
jgi:transcription elongation factor GreA